ncbi:MAG: hypothetical protein LBM09_00710, partial [Candidatus Nomurabacteria bacterium]|nr:hypothetical protein [Candidatus Nomurabacteria bacterium]
MTPPPQNAFKPQQTTASRIIAPPTNGQGFSEPRPADPPKPKPVANVNQIYNTWRNTDDIAQQPANPSAPIANPATAQIQTQTSIQNPAPFQNPETAQSKPKKQIRYNSQRALIWAIITLIIQIPFVMKATGKLISSALYKLPIPLITSLYISSGIAIALRIIPVVILIWSIIVLIKTRKTKTTPAGVVPVIAISAIAVIITIFTYVVPIVSSFLQYKRQQNDIQLSGTAYSISEAVSSYRDETGKVPTSLSDIKSYIEGVDNVDSLKVEIIQAQAEYKGSIDTKSGTFTV